MRFLLHVGDGVEMEPIIWRWINELVGIIAAGPHGCADDVSQVPRLQHCARMCVYFQHKRFKVRCGVGFQDNSNFAGVDVMMKIGHSYVRVITNGNESAVELDSVQLRAIREIHTVIKEPGGISHEASRAHPSQRSVRIDDGRHEIAASSLNHDVVIA